MQLETLTREGNAKKKTLRIRPKSDTSSTGVSWLATDTDTEGCQNAKVAHPQIGGHYVEADNDGDSKWSIRLSERDLDVRLI